MRKFADIHKKPNGAAVARPSEQQTAAQMPYFLKMRSPMHTPHKLAAQKSERYLGLNTSSAMMNSLQVHSPRPAEMNYTTFVSSPRPNEINVSFISSPRPTADKSMAKAISQNRLGPKAKMSCLFVHQQPVNQNHHYPATDRTHTIVRINSSKVLHPLENQLNTPKLLSDMEAKSIISIDDSHDHKREDISIIRKFDEVDCMTSPRYNRRQSIIDAFYDQ